MTKIDNITDVIRARHSVRKYTDRVIEDDKASVLNNEIIQINRESGLCFCMCLEEPEAYQANKPHYGSFKGCKNYFVLFGPKGQEEKVGYYGEHLVLKAQSLGLNTCWCAMTFEKNKLAATAPEGMVLHDVIALGYGETQGIQHNSKPASKLSNIRDDSPEWFKNGVEAAILAPTAINQQKFYLELIGERTVRAKALLGPCYKTDIGIVKYHFETVAGKENFEWEE